MLKLYYAPSTCALASHIVLEDVCANYMAIEVNFSREEQKSREYLGLNPKARVPTLITPQGNLTETPAILLFIAQKYSNAKIAPLNDIYLLAESQSFNSYLCSTVHVAHAHRGRGYRWADDPAAILAMKKKVPESVGQCFDLIDRVLLKGPYVLGDNYSICDPYLFTLTGWLKRDGLDHENFPRVNQHYRMMLQRPSVQKVLPFYVAG